MYDISKKFLQGCVNVDEFYIARVTTKGQVTVPMELRKHLKIKEGDYILFKKNGTKIEIKKMVEPNDFENFARPIRERFQKGGITPEDVEDAINWARGNHK
ncbi:Transcriptional regulator, AbrB family [Desulforamulus hydrothermalis Lam5 = DSM 18033]|uniref:Transcriptional regulator, AbrB family n=1 Tax=Desulforamulus hydrothermalis Lam5 = DSM 18033 TaxID=1121428 RepID=K8DZG2_9FIRM|nr:Transcriptional regulator, AbrB family [Desulforamulus hydrothermalis Lam5 = DSM 18033]SHH51770.1 looped-hinge helix DNA binding domain-containing protein, AbrB family [Desulforamulus hydrothermalis Lam5 = DSM 18033]